MMRGERGEAKSSDLLQATPVVRSTYSSLYVRRVCVIPGFNLGEYAGAGGTSLSPPLWPRQMDNTYPVRSMEYSVRRRLMMPVGGFGMEGARISDAVGRVRGTLRLGTLPGWW